TPATRLVAAPGALDFDDVRTKIAQQHATARSRHCLGQIENANVVKDSLHKVRVFGEGVQQYLRLILVEPSLTQRIYFVQPLDDILSIEFNVALRTLRRRRSYSFGLVL